MSDLRSYIILDLKDLISKNHKHILERRSDDIEISIANIDKIKKIKLETRCFFSKWGR